MEVIKVTYGGNKANIWGLGVIRVTYGVIYKSNIRR